MATILVVDDEVNIRNLARIYLEKEGYTVQIATNGEEALAQFRSDPPDLIVLDLMMPKVDGIEVCRRVRAVGNLPIIMLTAKDDDIDKIIGLEIGADDYMTKPFNPRVLVARVRAVLRRATPSTAEAKKTQRLSLGNVRVDLAGRTVLVDNQAVDLRTKAFDLLVTLMEHVNIVLSRDQLLDLVWGYEYFGQTRTVDVHVAHLRDRLQNATLSVETVWGKGYKLTANN